MTAPRRSSWRRAAIGAALLAAATGCNVVIGPTCTLEARPGLLLVIHDAATGAPAVRGAHVVVRDGSFEEAAQISVSYDGPLGFAQERAGTYAVTVTQEGYRPWTRGGVRVERDRCHVRTVTLDVALQR